MTTDKEQIWPVKLKHELDRYVVGQNAYKIAVSMGVHRHIKGIKNSVLVLGPTGSGKTYLIQCLKKTKMMPEKFTIMQYNASTLTEAGLKGNDVEDIFSSYQTQCRAEGNKEGRGIIYIDEIDKIIAPSYVSAGNGSGVENKNAAVQHQLMQVLDGEKIAGVSTDKVMFIFGGSFSRMHEQENKQKTCGAIGFCADQEAGKASRSGHTIRERLLEFGFQQEFLGRIEQIVELEPLTAKELKVIMMHPTQGVLAKMKKEFLEEGVELNVESEAIDEIIRMAKKENLGARSVRNTLEKILQGSLFECLEKGYDRLSVDMEAVNGGSVRYEKRDACFL